MSDSLVYPRTRPKSLVFYVRAQGILRLDPLAILAVITVVAILGGATVLGRRLLEQARWQRPLQFLPDPVPPQWQAIILDNIPFARQLGESDLERLLKLTQVFLDQKHVEGAGGLEVTEQIRVTIAAGACVLLLWMPDVGCYPLLRTVIVYPGAMVPRYAGGGGTRHPDPILGQSWGSGVVILSWDSALHGVFDPRDGQNLVMHEFAHQLDQEDGEADGVPVGLKAASLKTWARVMERRYRRLVKAHRRNLKSVLDQYGATNRAEFFAVATEAFFEKPRQLRNKKPDLYDALADFYGVDPVDAGLAPDGKPRSTD